MRKGRSKAARLNDLVKELFSLMVKYCFVLDLQWIATDDNVNADHLSRKDRESDFLRTVYETEVWKADTVPLRAEGAGRTRVLPEKRGVLEERKEPEVWELVTRQEPVAEPLAEPDAYLKRALALAPPNSFSTSSVRL